jgi:hypothetical protein
MFDLSSSDFSIDGCGGWRQVLKGSESKATHSTQRNEF